MAAAVLERSRPDTRSLPVRRRLPVVNAVRPRSRTLGDAVAELAPGWRWADLCRWPPDAFAATSALLAGSGAYRLVVSPPPGRHWPPTQTVVGPGTWSDTVRRWGREWAESVGSADAPPTELARRTRSILYRARHTALAELDHGRNWDIVSALLTVHAAADEACADLCSGTPPNAGFARAARRMLRLRGSLSRLPTERARVLPKGCVPEAGITIRSLSTHVALDRSEVEPRWYHARTPARTDGKFTMLLVPYPSAIRPGDFRPVAGPLDNMDEDEYRFFEFVPQEPFAPEHVVALVRSASSQVGRVDAVVLPESVLDEQRLGALQQELWDAGVPYLIAGVRTPSDGSGLGASYAHVGFADGGGRWTIEPQYKHHRWCLDARQIDQYHLGDALDPRVKWWEAISIMRRRLTFICVGDGLTICPLVCEDLARPDPVSDVIRAVGPGLVVALLADGPQLASRWPARYASVLADDPGCSVLTLTSLGMATRSRPGSCPSSRVVALWKDRLEGLRELELAEGAEAIAVTTRADERGGVSADGRTHAAAGGSFVFCDAVQVAAPARPAQKLADRLFTCGPGSSARGKAA